MDRRSPNAPHLVAVNAGVARLARVFSAPVRGRAAPYVGTGCVEIIRDADTELHARVRGTNQYSTSFQRRGNNVEYSCTCPYFTSEYLCCKHLWALVLEAANGAFVRGVADCNVFTAGGFDLDDDDDDLLDDDELEDALSKTLSAGPARDWRSALAAVQYQSAERTVQLHYFVPRSALRTATRLGVRVSVGQVDFSLATVPLQPGARLDVRSLAHDIDRELYLLAVAPALPTQPYGTARHVVDVPAASFAMVLPKLAASGRCYFVPDDAREDDTWQSFSAGLRSRKRRSHASVDYDELLDWPKLGRDPGGDWQLRLCLAHADGRAAPGGFLLRGELERGETARPVSDVAYVDLDGNLIIDDLLSSCAPSDAIWIERLLAAPELYIPSAELEAFVVHAGGSRGPTRFRLPEEYRTLDDENPRPVIEISRPAGQKTYANVLFDYGVARVPARSAANLVFVDERTALVRQRAEESKHEGDLVLLGFRGPLLGDRSSAAEDVGIPSKALPEATRRLLDLGWSVYAEGKRLRASRSVKVEVKSGIDWFEVNGSAEFEGASLPFPALLAAVKRKQQMVELGDGSFGVLPEEWLSRWGVVAELVSDKGGMPRFSARQVGVLQTIVSVEPEVARPAALKALASKLEEFHAAAACDPPAGFVGELREYQRVGLGWLQTLRDLGLGACLADDMGLGKTVQLIAHLLACRGRRGRSRTASRPALVVAPRSLVANWQTELARFAPALRVYAHHGPERDATAQRWEKLDVVITTYATLRLDIALLSGVEFDTVVLDEAQSIKNDDSATAKCAKRLEAAHRIALSGTPIENHLGELWSLFEFLNPGLLDELPALKKSLDGKKPSPEALVLIGKVVRPFVLRRTKAEVAKDLPERVEQTLYVDLDVDQRAHYDEILRHYQASVKKKLSSEPAARATPHVLEALLRLRQAACHPGLLDGERSDERSAKLDVLLSRLRALSDEGHKVLVFSQFTRLLALVRRQLEREGLAYAYLDGKTVDRAACVERFQTDAAIGVFLISLKAGGVGLNLTAADYVFILDPWWNPAVEAQAIDRAHRIGQTRTVIAYRVLARNTVEERLVELQRQKRDLAAAIFNDGSALSGRLTREDLQQLLDLS